MAFACNVEKTGSNALKFDVSKATVNDLKGIVELINAEAKKSGAVLLVSEKEVGVWIKSGLDFVAKDESGKIIGHQSAAIWPESGWIELRAGVVLPEFRGNGVNSKLKVAIINEIESKFPGATIVSLKNNVSGGRGTVAELGFHKVQQSEAPEELFKIGPKGENYDVYVYTTKIAEKGLLRS